MIPSKTLSLIQAWRTALFSQYSIADVMQISGKRSKPWVFNGLNHLKAQRLITLERKGNLNLYSLDLDNPVVPSIVHYLDSQQSLTYSGPLKDLLRKIPSRIDFSLLVFGSYADGSAKKTSDLDLCFLVHTEKVGKSLKPFLNEAQLSSVITLDAHFITFDDFVKMLLRDEENLAKQVYRKSRIIFNPTRFFRLLKEARKHGFNPR